MTRVWYGNHCGLHLQEHCIADCSHQGDCSADTDSWYEHVEFPARDLIVRELSEYGAWEDLDTVDLATLQKRLLWVACCDCAEEDRALAKEARPQ